MSFAPTHQARLIKKPLCVAIALLGIGVSARTFAQEPMLEEIIVTSQKRPQSLQDVPISVASVSGEKLEKMGVENLEDLSSYVPNLHFTETGLGTQLRIRGIGSDNSQGFEQSVGVYVDGIQHGRGQLFRAPIFDMERVEVMRGPQGTLFGKNSIAGALELITAKPTDSFEGQATASHESEFGTNEYSAYLSGPMSDKVKARVALRSYKDPGYMENAYKGTNEANQEEFTLRGIVDIDFSDNFKAMLKAEHSTFDIIGRFSETTLDRPATSSSPTYGQILQNPAFNNGVPGPTIEPNLDYVRNINAPDFSNNSIDTVTLQLDYSWHGHTITALTGQVGFDADENCDCDYTPANIFNLDLYEDYKQLSQEIRIVSPSNQSVEWVAGVFYQKYEQTFTDQFNIPATSLLPTFLSLIPNLPTPTQQALPVLRGAGIARNFEQNSKAWAIFGEVTWHVTSDFNVALGARFTEEDKDASKELNAVDITNSTELTGVTGATAAQLYKGLFAVDTEQLKLAGSPTGHLLEESRSESAFTPSLTLGYYFNEDVMTYAKVSRGFKAGGFDPRSNNAVHFEFEEEKVTAFETGTKLGLAEGRGELNIALFHMKYDNLQISQFDGKLGFNIGNTKDTTVQGLELNGRWQLNKHFSSSFGMAYLDFEYQDFKNGNCYEGQTPDSTDPETGAPLCDYTGMRGVYTPKLTLNGSLEYRRDLTSGMEFVQTIDAQRVGEQMVHVNQDPAGMMDAYTLLGLRIGVETDIWSVALLGQNLLDEYIISYSGNTPLSGTIARSDTHYSFVRRPRTIAITGSYKF